MSKDLACEPYRPRRGLHVLDCADARDVGRRRRRRIVAVTADAGCAWTATGNASWITVGVASGSGNGTVTYSVAPYTGKPKKRTGTITIAGQTLTVQQSR